MDSIGDLFISLTNQNKLCLGKQAVLPGDCERIVMRDWIRPPFLLSQGVYLEGCRVTGSLAAVTATVRC